MRSTSERSGLIQQKSMNDIIYIRDHESLAAWCQVWSRAEIMAIDTEFIRTNTFYPQLALIQVAVDIEPHKQFIIDPLAVNDLELFFDRVKDDRCVKVMHAGNEDLEILYQCMGELPCNLIDTQIAASLIGDPMQMGYSALLYKHFGIEIDKAETRTNWLDRPLTSLQVDYAARDVQYLIGLYQFLMLRIKELQRTTWCQEECARLRSRIFNQKHVHYPLQKLGELKGLHPKEKNKARALALWRENIAQQDDVPRRFVLSDASLIRLSKRRHLIQVQDLFSFDIPGKTVKKYGVELIDLLSSPSEIAYVTEQEWGQESEIILPSGLKVSAWDCIRERAQQLQIEPSFLMPKRLMQVFLVAFWQKEFYQKEVLWESSELQGWRRAEIVEPLHRYLQSEMQKNKS